LAMTDAWLNHLRGSLWLTHAPAQLVRAELGPDGQWSLGAIIVSEAELLAAQPAGPVDRIRLFHLVHEGWRVASFRLFRPLVYFAAFSAPEIFACLQLAVSSLVEQGGWQWDVLVLTAPETAEKVRVLLESCGLGERLHVASVSPAQNRLDWCMARYHLDAHPVQLIAQPLLYLDTDVICDRPLEPLLGQLAASPAVHACAEGRLDEGHPDSAGHWFGWRLMAEDGMPFDRNAPGFSAGILGVANAASAEVPFSLILRSVYADIASIGGGHKLVGQDQAFANYVLRKLGRFEIGLMSQVVQLHRLDVGKAQFPDPAAARGLVHFLGAPTGEKLKAMQDYAAALRQHAVPKPTLGGT
jgi:hypothetical protein